VHQHSAHLFIRSARPWAALLQSCDLGLGDYITVIFVACIEFCYNWVVQPCVLVNFGVLRKYSSVAEIWRCLFNWTKLYRSTVRGSWFSCTKHGIHCGAVQLKYLEVKCFTLDIKRCKHKWGQHVWDFCNFGCSQICGFYSSFYRHFNHHHRHHHHAHRPKTKTFEWIVVFEIYR